MNLNIPNFEAPENKVNFNASDLKTRSNDNNDNDFENVIHTHERDMDKKIDKGGESKNQAKPSDAKSQDDSKDIKSAKNESDDAAKNTEDNTDDENTVDVTTGEESQANGDYLAQNLLSTEQLLISLSASAVNLSQVNNQIQLDDSNGKLKTTDEQNKESDKQGAATYLSAIDLTGTNNQLSEQNYNQEGEIAINTLNNHELSENNILVHQQITKAGQDDDNAVAQEENQTGFKKIDLEKGPQIKLSDFKESLDLNSETIHIGDEDPLVKGFRKVESGMLENLKATEHILTPIKNAALDMTRNIQVQKVAPTNSMPEIDQASLMRQVTEGVRNVVKAGHQEIQLRLDPPSWGRIEVRIGMHNNEVHVTMMAENAAVKDNLDRGVQGLRQSLAEQGLNLGSLNVGVGGEKTNQRDGDDQGREARDERGILAMAKKRKAASRYKDLKASAIDRVV